MSSRTGIALNLLATGVPGLDAVLGGGMPEYSFNLVAGSPGAGKTTMVHQLMFANASADRPALYFTALGEPSLKMLRYQQQMEFFDPAMVGDAITYVDLSADILSGSLDDLLIKMAAHVAAVGPAIVIVDSFRSIASSSGTPERRADLQAFMQRLAMTLTSWQVTSFLLGEYTRERWTRARTPSSRSPIPSSTSRARSRATRSCAGSRS